MKSENGGPAFPVNTEGSEVSSSYEPHPGMTLRDYFAAKALQGFCANPAIFAANDRSGWGLVNCTDEQLSSACLRLADAMLAERAQ